MPYHPDVRRVAACPACGGALDWHADAVLCIACDRRYEIADCVPGLLVADAPEPVKEPVALTGLPAPLKRLAYRFRRFKPELTYKSERSERLVTDFASSTVGLVVNVGSGGTDVGSGVLNIDIAPFPNVHVLGTAEHLPVATASCDAVILQAVLEHVLDPDASLRHVRRALRPGGRIHVEVPFVQGYHPTPGDYRRYTEEGLRASLCAHGFEVEASGVVEGPASAAAWIFADFLALLLSGRSASGYRAARLLTRFVAAPIRHADRWLESHPMANVVASGVWARGRVT